MLKTNTFFFKPENQNWPDHNSITMTKTVYNLSGLTRHNYVRGVPFVDSSGWLFRRTLSVWLPLLASMPTSVLMESVTKLLRKMLRTKLWNF